VCLRSAGGRLVFSRSCRWRTFFFVPCVLAVWARRVLLYSRSWGWGSIDLVVVG
jgi:hypothetical protein